jgi:hypothetical protein
MEQLFHVLDLRRLQKVFLSAAVVGEVVLGRSFREIRAAGIGRENCWALGIGFVFDSGASTRTIVVSGDTQIE